MKLRGISLTIIKIIYALIIFIVSLIIFSNICNQGNMDMTDTMSSPSFPMVSLLYDDYEVNTMYGFDQVIDTTHFRNNISPLMPGRKLTLKINTYGETIFNIKYEIRDLSGERLIESSDVYNYIEQGNNVITADITLKDLLQDNMYYSLCVILEKSSGANIRYYTNIIKSDEISPQVFIQFADYFTKTCFDKEKAITELVTYMETDGSSLDNDFHHVDIHSSINQLSWGKLNASIIDEPGITIEEIDGNMATIMLHYYISINQDEKDIFYDVKDVFRIRKGEERIFLLDFDREVNQIFSLNTATIKNNKIVFGISGTDVNMKESKDGNLIAFEKNGRLYSYNIVDNKMAYIFGFYEDGREMDARMANNDHGIKIFNVDEMGNIYFMVYGYMNRGKYEGKMGAVIYYYDSSINNIEEKIFISYDKSFEFLENEVNKLSYVNANEQGFVFVNDTLYQINLEDASSKIIVQNVPFRGIVVSDNNDKAAWIGGGDINNATQISFLNLSNGKISYIQAEDDERLRVIGFFGEDLVYGVAKKNEIVTDAGGNGVFPMNKIYIRNEGGQVLKEYKEDGYYIVDTKINEDMLALKRAFKTENGYSEAEDDQILNNKSVSELKNKVEGVVTENYEKLVQLILKKDVQRDKMLVMTPKFVIFEGNRDIDITETNDYTVYYTYVGGRLEFITDRVSEAVEMAYEKSGVVINEAGRCVYSKTVYPNKNQIMAITETGLQPGEDVEMTKAVCLNTIFAFEGKTYDSRGDIRNRKSIYEIMSENLSDYNVLNIEGCDVNTYMYYLAQDIPIYLNMKTGASYLLIGYNEYNFVFFDTEKGTIYKVGIEDTASLIQKECDEVFTYVRNSN